MPILTGKQINELIIEQSVNSLKIAVDESIDIYEDNWNYIIEEELSRQFGDQEYKKHLLLYTKEINLVKRVVNELSLIYKKAPVRQVITDEQESPEGERTITTDDNYDKVTKDSTLDVTMSAAETYTNLTNHVLIKPVVRKSKLDYDLILFNNAEVLTDPEDWKRVIAVKYYVGLKLPKDYDKFASADQTVKFNTSSRKTEHGTLTHEFSKAFIYTLEDMDTDEGKIVAGKIYTVRQFGDSEKVVDSETIDNPYKDSEGNTILPFILTYKDYPVRKLLNFSTGNDLIDGNIGFALNLAYLNNLRKYQSFIQGYITGSSPEGLPETVNLGPSTWMKLWDRNGGATIGTINLEANIESFWKVMKEEAALVLAQYNIKPSNFELSASPESGFSALMSNADKLEYRESKIPFWRMFEKQVYEVSKIVWNTDGPGDVIGDGTFKVNFADITFPQTAQDEQTMFNFEKFNNAKTSIDLVKDRDPDLTDNEAMAEYNKNKIINDAERRTNNIQPIEQPNRQPVRGNGKADTNSQQTST